MLILLLFISLFLIPSVGKAGNPTDSVAWNIKLHEMVIAGESPRQSLLLPQQTYLLDAETMRASGLNSTPALLESSGAVAVQKSQGGGGSPIVRGFEASRILLVMDDVRMNNLIYRSGHLQNLLTADPFSLASMEVIYGSASVLYGSDALGGVIHLRTLRPELNRTNGEAMIRYGSASNEANGHFHFNIGTNKWASFTSVTFNHFGDLRAGRRKNPFLPDTDAYIWRKWLVETIGGEDKFTENPKSYQQVGAGYQQLDIVQKISFAPDANQRHTFNLQYSGSSDINRYDRLTDLSKGKPKFAEWYYGPQLRLMGAYHYHLTHLPYFDRMHLTAAYQRVRESRHNRKLNDAWRTNRTEDVEIASVSLDFYKSAGKNKWEGGFDGALNFLHTSAFSNDIYSGETKALDTRYPLGKNRMHQGEFFIQHQYEASDRVQFSEGIRGGYNYVYSEFREQPWFPFLNESVAQHNLTYSIHADVTWKPVRQFILTGIVQSGFRVPNIDDMGKVFDSGAGFVVVPNRDLKPEKTIGGELHADWYVSDQVRFSPVVYATYLFDAIGLASTTLHGADSILYEGELSPIYANHNNRKAVVYGASVQLHARLLKSLSLDASWNYTRGRILGKTGNTPLDHIPPAFGRIGINYQKKGWEATLWSLFNHRKQWKDYNPDGEDNIRYATLLGESGNGLPAWFTLNARVAKSFSKGVHLQLSAENLLDTEYRTFASGINAPGRNITCMVRYEW
ncbi:MAG: TonB-dependent receptor [Bacteroidales bacterium]